MSSGDRSIFAPKLRRRCTVHSCHATSDRVHIRTAPTSGWDSPPTGCHTIAACAPCSPFLLGVFLPFRISGLWLFASAVSSPDIPSARILPQIPGTLSRYLAEIGTKPLEERSFLITICELHQCWHVRIFLSISASGTFLVLGRTITYYIWRVVRGSVQTRSGGWYVGVPPEGSSCPPMRFRAPLGPIVHCRTIHFEPAPIWTYEIHSPD